MALIRINPTKILVGGDTNAAKDFMGQARSQMEILKSQMSFHNLSQGVRKLWINDDVYVECRKIFDYQECKIWSRIVPAPIVEEETLFGFILIISSQSEQEAIAWDLSQNAILTNLDNTPMQVDTLENVKEFVSDYIKRTDLDNKLADGEVNPIQLTPTGSYYESWWRRRFYGQTMDGSEYQGDSDVTEWNALSYIWPDYYHIDYSKMSSADYIVLDPEELKVSKIHHPEYYEGVLGNGDDPLFVFYSAITVTIPCFTPGDIEVDGQFVINKRPYKEWMTPYIEHINPETNKLEKQESSNIIMKYGTWLPEDTPERIKDGQGCSGQMTGPQPDYYEQSFFWFASIFGTDYLHSFYDETSQSVVNTQASKSNLDATTDFLFDSFGLECHAEIQTDGYCEITSYPFSNFGMAENDNGAVVADFCTIAWGYNSNDLTDDQKYRGALSGEYSQIFRLYNHQNNFLENDALAIFNAHNVIRDQQGLKRFSSNLLLTKAAQKHANDLATNDFLSHTGSDGSTAPDRMFTAGYFLWVINPDGTTKNNYNTGENAAQVDLSTDDSVERTIQGWKDSPGHWANMIDEDYDEIGVGVAIGMHEGYEMIWSVVDFGSIDGKWAGFSQVDTTDMLTFINNNFVWAGDGDNIRVPKLFLT